MDHKTIKMVRPHIAWRPRQNILQKKFSCIKIALIQISVECVPKCSLNNKSALFHISYQTGHKPLSPTMTVFTDAYYASLGLKELSFASSTNTSTPAFPASIFICPMAQYFTGLVYFSLPRKHIVFNCYYVAHPMKFILTYNCTIFSFNLQSSNSNRVCLDKNV